MIEVLKKIRDYLGLFGIKFIILLTKILPIYILSPIFGILAVFICPFIPTTRLVLKNLKFAMPEKNFLERIKIVFGVWYNLGQFAGEYFYIYKMKKDEIFNYVKISEEAEKNIDGIINGNGSLIFSAHFSNWEAGLRALRDKGVRLNVVFRRSNNTLVEPKYTAEMREKLDIRMIAKQDNAGIKIIKALKRGETVLLLVDQRDSLNGELINFFGKKAYTNRSIFTLGKKMNIPIYGARVVRDGGRVAFDLKMKKIEINENEVNFLQKINDIVEEWVRKNPDQWFWVHNRWKGNEEFEKIK